MPREQQERAAVQAAGLAPIRLVDNRCCDGVKSQVKPSHPAAVCKDCPHRLRSLDTSRVEREWIAPLAKPTGLTWGCETRERDAVRTSHAEPATLDAETVAAVDEMAMVHVGKCSPSTQGAPRLPVGGSDVQQHTSGVSSRAGEGD